MVCVCVFVSVCLHQKDPLKSQCSRHQQSVGSGEMDYYTHTYTTYSVSYTMLTYSHTFLHELTHIYTNSDTNTCIQNRAEFVVRDAADKPRYYTDQRRDMRVCVSYIYGYFRRIYVCTHHTHTHTHMQLQIPTESRRRRRRRRHVHVVASRGLNLTRNCACRRAADY